MNRFFTFCTDRPRTVTFAMVALALGLALIAALPSIWPGTFAALHPVEVDTDPENMLPHDEPVRVFHDAMKRELALYDMIVVGVVNDAHPQGVFNPESLRQIYELAEFAKTLQWPAKDDPGQTEGVVEADLIAPSTVDNIEQEGVGTIRFEWLMAQPPETDAEALAVRDKARRIPFLDGTLLSDDGKALALYVPITSKDLSYEVAARLREKIETFDGDDRFFITGLPVAEDTFGVEMFIQMVVCAPLAMAISKSSADQADCPPESVPKSSCASRIVTYGSSLVMTPVTATAVVVPKFVTCTGSSSTSPGLAWPSPFPKLEPLASSSIVWFA